MYSFNVRGSKYPNLAFEVVRNDNKVYAVCRTQALAANVCMALNIMEQQANQALNQMLEPNNYAKT